MPTRDVSGRIEPNDGQTKRVGCKEREGLVEGVGCCSLNRRRWRARANNHPETDASPVSYNLICSFDSIRLLRAL